MRFHVSHWRFYRLYCPDWQGNAVAVLRCLRYSKSVPVSLSSMTLLILITPTDIQCSDLFSYRNTALDHCGLRNAAKGTNGRIVLCTVSERPRGQGKAGSETFWGEDCLMGLYIHKLNQRTGIFNAEPGPDVQSYFGAPDIEFDSKKFVSL